MPFAEKKSPWPKIIVSAILLVVAYLTVNKLGYLYDWTNSRIGDPRPARFEKVPPAPIAPTEAPAKGG